MRRATLLHRTNHIEYARVRVTTYINDFIIDLPMEELSSIFLGTTAVLLPPDKSSAL